MLTRLDLQAEGLRLGRPLCDLVPWGSEVFVLFALMAFGAARVGRFEGGNFVTKRRRRNSIQAAQWLFRGTVSVVHEMPADPALARVARPVLERWLHGRLPDGSRAWLDKALDDSRRGGPAGADFAAAWSSAGRRLGRAPLGLGEDDRRALVEDRATFVPAGWGTDELGRALLLLAATEGRPPDLLPPLVEDLFRKGEMREQQALLRVLAYLPEPGAYASLAAEAVRGNVVSVLEALACDNPFPAAYMDGLAFNQMVMKAVFNGLPLGRIVGLPARTDKELGRMARALASERRAAGRTVPQDLQDLRDRQDPIDPIDPPHRSS